LLVPVQVIAWKDSSPKWPVMRWEGRKTLLTHPSICVDDSVLCQEVNGADIAMLPLTVGNIVW